MNSPSALTGDPNKRYGLILRKKSDLSTTHSTVRPKTALFNEDDDADVSVSKSIGDAIRKEGNKALWKKETQSRIQQALEDDPTVFDYDNVYDKMTQQKAANSDRIKEKETGKEREPKYMQALLAAAAERNKEHDRRLERKVQREREEEGGQFAGKEAFVTSAYKKKMQELQEQEMREKQMDKIEAQLDVTKQKDLGGFYRHLLKQTTGEEKVRNAGERSVTLSLATPGNSREASEDTKRKNQSLEDTERTKRSRSSTELRTTPIDLPTAMDVEEPQRAETEEGSLSSTPERRTRPSSPAAVLSPTADVAPAELSVNKATSDHGPDMKQTLAKRATEATTMSARERYLARQAATKAPGLTSSDA